MSQHLKLLYIYIFFIYYRFKLICIWVLLFHMRIRHLSVTKSTYDGPGEGGGGIAGGTSSACASEPLLRRARIAVARPARSPCWCHFDINMAIYLFIYFLNWFFEQKKYSVINKKLIFLKNWPMAILHFFPINTYSHVHKSHKISLKSSTVSTILLPFFFFDFQYVKLFRFLLFREFQEMYEHLQKGVEAWQKHKQAKKKK